VSAARVALVEFEPRRLDELVTMWRASFEAGVGIVDPHPLAQQRSYFVAEVLPRNDVSVALRDEQMVGFVAATRESITQLYVRVGCQRQGIGRTLLDWAKDRSNGHLWLYTFARNRGAQAFYERNGFAVAARGFEPTWQLEDIRYEWCR
jgi:ribosomal protein S18 acetylase RimI-like enzyme